jgi:hypothetical protein
MHSRFTWKGIKMDQNILKKDITMDESIERIIRIIHQNVILFYQAYQDFNNLATNHTDLKEYELKLNTSVNKIVSIKKICINEFEEFVKQNKNHENNDVIKDLQIMINDLEQYSKKLEFVMAKILNNNIINSDKYKKEINEQFTVIFDKYNEFIKADEEIIVQLAKLENKIRLRDIKS